MANADELLAAGDIHGARSALINEVRRNPGDVPVRMFLFQLFSLTGEWKRAKDQLDILAKLDPETRMLSVAYSQCIDAEEQREQVFAGEADMPMLAKIDWGETLARGIRQCQTGDSAAEATLSEAFDKAPGSSGQTDAGQSFDWIMDSDPRFGPTLEAIIAGRYGIMPFSALETLKIHKPRDLRDTIWAQAEFGLREGARVAGFVPVRYPGSEKSDDPALVRGQATTWEDNNGSEAGLGHRLLVLSDGSESPLLSFEQINFEEE